jgi:2-polyprenyl-6-methoxyphenol hydroxylase-like FAD-dependent oxidoreductase
VGAGPVGLLTAIELTLGGVGVLVLERLAAGSAATKALTVGPLGSEALQRRGMAAAMAAAEAHSLAAMKPFMEQIGSRRRGRSSKISGHFAGLSLIRADAQKDPERRSHAVDQQAVEAMLADRAGLLGIAVRRACEVVGFVEQSHGIDVKWASPVGEGGVHCSYLIGCDGGRSSVRKMAGFDFPGTPPTMTMYQAVAELDHSEALPAGFHHTSGGVLINGPLPGRLFLLDFSGPPEDRESPVTREEIEDVLRRISGSDIRVKAVAVGRTIPGLSTTIAGGG